MLALFLSLSLQAATHISDTRYLNDGVTPSPGTISISGPSGGLVSTTTRTITINSDGTVDFYLVGCPGCSYRAVYTLNGPGIRTQRFEEKWSVPDTTRVLTIPMLWVGSAASQNTQNWNNMNPAGYTIGDGPRWDGTSFVPSAPGSGNAIQIQGRTVGSTVPANAYALVWNAAANQWEPQAQSGGGVPSIFGRTGAVVAIAGDYGAFYSPLAHVHLTADITGLTAALAAKQATITGAPPSWPATFTASLHGAAHAAAGSDPVTLTEAQITGLTADLAAKQTIGAPVPVGAPAGTVGASLFYSPNDALNVKAFGAKGDGATDDTAAIQSAHAAACAAGGGGVYYPRGVYVFQPVAGAQAGTFQLCSNLHVFGAGIGVSTLKVKNNAGNYWAIYQPVPISAAANNVTFNDFTIDQNATGNTTSNIATVNVTTTGQLAILLYAGANFHVSQMQFVCTGINTVVANGDGTVTGVFINQNSFIFGARVGQPAFDVSTIYVKGKDFHIDNNAFNTLNSAISDNAGTAIEVHLGNGTVTGNTIAWYAAGGNIVDTFQTVVSNNSISNASVGLTLWALAGHSTDGNSFQGNTISLNQKDRLASDSWGIATDYATGITGTHDNLTIQNNQIRAQQELVGRAVAGLNAGISLAAIGQVSNALVQNNVVVNAPVRGIRVGLAGAPATTIAMNVLITGNTIIDAGTNPATVSYNSAIEMEGNLTDVRFFRNTIRFTTNPFSGNCHAQSIETGATFSRVYSAENTVTALNGNPANCLSASVIQTFSTAPAVRTCTTGCTTTPADGLVLCDSTSASFVTALGSAAPGQVITLKKIAAANYCWIGGAGVDAPAGSLTLTTLNQTQALQWDAVAGFWRTVGSTGEPVTATQVGLGNVNNTSDAAKPISTAELAALALKEPTLTAAGVMSKFTGCSGTMYPGFDGACHTAGVGGVGTPSPVYAVTAQLSFFKTAVEHGQGTSPVVVCFDSPDGSGVALSCNYSRALNGDITASWVTPFTGSVQISPLAGGVVGPVGPTGPSNGWTRTGTTIAPTNAGDIVRVVTTLPGNPAIVLGANGGQIPLVACAGTPGGTTGGYQSLCIAPSTSALWACKNAAGCMVAADWLPVGGAGTIPPTNVWSQYPFNLAFAYQSTPNPGWYATAATQTAQNANAPDGTNNALTLLEDTSNNEHYSLTAVSYPVAAGQPITFTAACKNITGTRNCAFHIFNALTAGGLFVGINPNTCAVNSTASSTGNWSTPKASTSPLGNGWCQVTLSGIVGELTNALSVDFSMLNGATTIYVGDGTSIDAFWGVSVASQIAATSSVPTITGCGTISGQAGIATAGTFVTNATTCVPALTALPRAAVGYMCSLVDRTNPTTTPLFNRASSTTSATFASFTTTASDVLAFSCTAY